MQETWRWGVPLPLSMSIAASCMINPIQQWVSGLPHRLMEDDVYRGMHIPKGSLVRLFKLTVLTRTDILSISRYLPTSGPYPQLYFPALLCAKTSDVTFFWRCRAIMHDEEIYPDSYTFNPDRFLTKVDADTERKRNPRNYVFGFGRRFVLSSSLDQSLVRLMLRLS